MPTQTPPEGLFISELPNGDYNNDNAWQAVIETSSGTKKIDLLPYLRMLENELYSGYKYSINTVADMTLKGYALENGGVIQRINYADFCDRFISHHNSRYTFDGNTITMKDMTDHWAYNSNNDDPFSRILSSVPDHYHKVDDNLYTLDAGELGNFKSDSDNSSTFNTPTRYHANNGDISIIWVSDMEYFVPLVQDGPTIFRDTPNILVINDRSRLGRGRTAGDFDNPIVGRDIEVYPNSYNQNAYSYIGEYNGTTNKESYSMFDPITKCYKGKVVLLGDNGLNKLRMTQKMPKDSDIKDIVSFYGSNEKRDRFLMFIGDRFEIVGMQEFMFQVNKYKQEQLSKQFPKIGTDPLTLDGYTGELYNSYRRAIGRPEITSVKMLNKDSNGYLKKRFGK